MSAVLPHAGAQGGLRVAMEMITRQRDAAAVALAQARDSQGAAQGQLDQLQQYAQESEARWTQQAQIRATPELMQHHYQFMARLYHTVELQNSVMAQHARQVQARIDQLREAELRLASLSQVVARKARELARLQQRREQKEVDEFATRQSLRHAGAFGGQD
ncbi:flagellar FliJ family protein [Xylophilus sp. GW821-FHT01B05]